MGIELTGCDACDKSLAESKDLCNFHKLEMISAQLTFWTNRACEVIKLIQEEMKEQDNG